MAAQERVLHVPMTEGEGGDLGMGSLLSITVKWPMFWQKISSRDQMGLGGPSYMILGNDSTELGNIALLSSMVKGKKPW